MDEAIFVKTINYVKLLFLFLFILAVTRSVFSENINYEEIKADFLLNSIVKAKGDIERGVMNITCPQNNENQKVVFEQKNLRLLKDDFGNDICSFELTGGKNEYSVTLKGSVDVKAIHTKELKEEYSLKDVSKYLEPTENIQSNETIFKELAKNITYGAESEFEKIAKLAIWVNNYLTYDLRYSDMNYDALLTLKNKKGVCAEYSTLYTALARSIGIPTRYISAYAYGENGWERHGYAESFIGGKWVPVDPLWLQIGYLDASHIKFGAFKDNKIENNIVVEGKNLKGAEWVKDEYTWKIKENKTHDSIPYEYETNREVYYEGNKGILLLKFKPEEYATAKIILSKCKGNIDLINITNPEKDIILIKGKSSLAYWTFSINNNLPKNHIYTCPVFVNSKSLKERSIKIIVDTTEKKTYNDETEVEFSHDDKEGQVFVKGNTKEREKIWVIHNNELIYEDYINENFEILKSFKNKIGENEVLVFTSHGLIKSTKYYINSEKHNFNINTNSKVRVNNPLYLNISFDKKIKDIKLIISYNNKSFSKVYKNREKIKEKIIFTKPGITKININLFLDGNEHKTEKYVNIIDKPIIELYGIIKGNKEQIILKNKGYDAKNITLNTDNKEFHINLLRAGNEKIIEYQKKEEKQQRNYILTYYDLMNKKYTEHGTYYIKKETLIQKIKNIITEIINFLKEL